MTDKRAIHMARHQVVTEARAHYYNPKHPTKYLEFWRMALAALIKAKAERPVDKSDDFGNTVTAVEQEPQRIAIALARAAQRNPKGAKAFFKLIDTFCKEADHEQK